MQAPLIVALATSLPIVMVVGVLVWVGRSGPPAHAQSNALESPSITGFEDDTGIQGDRITSDNLPTLFGTAGANLTVRTHRGNSVLGDTNSDEDGSWSLALQHPLPDGVHSLTATAVDDEGIVSDRSEPFALTIDTTAPDRPVIVRFDDDTGLLNDNTTNDTTLTLTGRAEAQSGVEVFGNGASLGSTTADGIGDWSFVTTELEDGYYRITAAATDAAGNVGRHSEFLLAIVDTEPPPKPVISGYEDDDGSQTEPATEDTTPTLRGTTISYAVVTFFEGDTNLGATDADSRGRWRFDVPQLSPGVHAFTAKATDDAGNQGPASDIFRLAIGPNTPPSFDEGETAERSVAENAVGGALIGSPVSATDPDTGDIVRFTLESTDDGPFSIDSETGQITLAAQHDLDSETTPTYTLTVTVTDFLATSDSITITITVTEAVAPDPPPAPTSGFSLGESSDGPESKLTFSWHEPTMADGDPAIASYDVRYREVSTPALDWTKLQDVATTATSDVPALISASITGLKSNTTYEAQVRSVSGSRSSAWAPETPARASTAMAQLTAAFSAGSYAVDEGAAMTVAVHVTPDADRDDEVTVTSSGIGVIVSGLSANGVLAITRGQNSATFTISGIEDADSSDASVELSLSLTASGMIAIGEPSSANITVRDVVSAPGIPRSLTVEALGARQIDIGWEAPASDGGAPVLEYSIEWSGDGSTWPEGNRFTTASTTYSDYSVELAATRYYRVSATNRLGSGAPTQPESATTPRLNAAPTFDEGETAERTIPEDAAGGSLVGSPVSATDTDSGDMLRYKVLATDDGPFFIDSGCCCSG